MYCFVVATLQRIQDRFNIRNASKVVRGDDFRMHHFDLQAAVDDFSQLHAHEQQRLEDTGIQMSRNGRTAGTPAWRRPDRRGEGGSERKAQAAEGTSLSQWSSSVRNAPPPPPTATRNEFPVQSVKVLSQEDTDELRNAVLRGPLVVAVRASGLWNLSEGGVPVECGGSGGADRDHVLSIVGWTEHAGEQHWIARNSWGDGRARLSSRAFGCAPMRSAKCKVHPVGLHRAATANRSNGSITPTKMGGCYCPWIELGTA